MLTPRSILWRLGYNLNRLSAGYWDRDLAFLDVYARVREHTLVKEHRAYILHQFAHAARHVPGDFAQVGVYKGGTARMVAEVLDGTGKKVLLFDTFEGLPGQTEMFADTSVEAVRSLFNDYSNVEFYQGYFPDTAHEVRNTFSLVYLDADLEQSIADGLDFFYPKMSPGGFIVIDDYGSKYWPGVKVATDSFAKKAAVHPIHSASGQCILVKR